LGAHGDLVLIMLCCILAYTLLLYYLLPSIAPSQYARVVAELSYYWRGVWHSVEYEFYTSYLPMIDALWQELMAFLPR